MQNAVKEEAECVAISGEDTDAKRPLNPEEAHLVLLVLHPCSRPG